MAVHKKTDDVFGRMKSTIDGIAVSTTENRPYIYKVHKHLRDVNDNAYEPETLAIGPYHHGKDNLKMMEQHKWRFLKALVMRKPDVTIETYISAVKEVEQHARSCYAEPIDHPDKFIEILVLDGCFIVELLLRWKTGNLTDPIFQTLWTTASLQRDLMLFENQIPFFVLCKLFDLIEVPNQHDRLMKLVLEFFHYVFYVDVEGINGAYRTSSQDGKLFELIKRCINLVRLSIYPGTEERNRGNTTTSHDLQHTNRNPQDVKHILDLLHSDWSCRCYAESDTGERNSRTNSSEQGHDDVHDHLNMQVKSDTTTGAEYDDVQRGFRLIQTATELKDANVEFRVLKVAHPTIFDVDFNKAAGILSMAPLRIDDRTECAFRNLIAFEQYFPNDRPTFFTDYTTLLDCLINSSRDVEILSRCKIIENWLGDHEVVAGLINRLGDSVSCAPRCLYDDTFRLINRHCKRKWNKAIANLKRNYFNSPWAYVSFSAAIVLLLLTVAQTVLAALQLP